MSGSKSAEKQARVAERRRIINKSIRSRCKTQLTKAEGLIASGEVETAREAVATAISSFDKAAEKGVINRNNAARHKSRLLKKLNKALSVAQAKPGTTEP